MEHARNPLAAGIYDRVSRDSRGDRRSIDEQSAGNRAAVDDNGWTLHAEYCADVNRSASRYATKVRDDWQRLLADLRAGHLDVLVLWEPSRGSRDLSEWSTLLDLARDHGVLIHVTSHHRTYDPRIARDWRTLAEDGVDSAYESEKTAARIRRTVTAGAVAGRPHGHVPYGYQRTYDARTRALVEQGPHPEHAPIVGEIIGRIAKGEPLSVVVDDLNGRGIPSPRGKTWSRFIVRRIATSPVYIGKRPHKDELYDATWPPLVDEGVYWAAVRLLSDPRRKVTRPGRQVHLLSYFAECGRCEAPLSARHVKALDDWTYNCSGGGHVSSRIAWFDEPVELLTLARLARPDAYESFAGADDRAVVEARAEVDELKARYEAFVDQAAEGKVSPDALARIEARLLPQIRAAEQRARHAAVPMVLRELVEPGTDVKARWKALTVAGKREVIQVIFARIALDPSAVRGGRRGGLDWSRVRVLPQGATEWIRLQDPQEVQQ